MLGKGIVLMNVTHLSTSRESLFSHFFVFNYYVSFHSVNYHHLHSMARHPYNISVTVGDGEKNDHTLNRTRILTRQIKQYIQRVAVHCRHVQWQKSHFIDMVQGGWLLRYQILYSRKVVRVVLERVAKYRDGCAGQIAMEWRITIICGSSTN